LAPIRDGHNDLRINGYAYIQAYSFSVGGLASVLRNWHRAVPAVFLNEALSANELPDERRPTAILFVQSGFGSCGIGGMRLLGDRFAMKYGSSLK
jgi:hypothetical protein